MREYHQEAGNKSVKHHCYSEEYKRKLSITIIIQSAENTEILGSLQLVYSWKRYTVQ